MRWVMGLLLVAGVFVAGYAAGTNREGVPPGRRARAASGSPAAERPRLLEALEPDTPERGTGEIVGCVVDARAQAVPGVLIVAVPAEVSTAEKMTIILVAPPAISFEEQVRRYAARTAQQRRRSRRVITGADGSYVLPDLVDGRYELRAYAEGMRIETTNRYWLGVAMPGGRVDWVAQRIARIDVEVILEDGSVPERVYIRATRQERNGGASTSADPWTPSSAWIELKEGNYTLRAEFADRSKAWSESVSLRVVAGSAPLRVSFRIQRKPSLRVTVVPPDGFGGVGARVHVMRFSGAERPAGDLLRQSSLRCEDDSNHSNVTYWHNLEPGRYLVGAERQQGAGFYVTKIVDVTVAQQPLSLQLPAPDPARHMLVRPVDPTGAAIRGVRWNVVYKSRYGWRRKHARAWPRDDGLYFIEQPALVNDEEGERILTAQHDSYGTAHAKFVLSLPVEVRFAKPAFLDAVLTEYKGSGREGRLAVSLNHPRLGELVAGMEPDSAGTVRFGPIQPGSYLLGLDKPRAFRGGDPGFSSTPVTVRSGEQSVALAIPPLYSLRIRWTGEGRPGYLLWKVDPTGPHFQCTADSNGVGLFRDLPPGKYELNIANLERDIPVRTVTIPETTELTLP